MPDEITAGKGCAADINIRLSATDFLIEQNTFR
jgi:hypothetical protein